MEIKEYKSLKEKESYFECVKIDKIADLDALVEEYVNLKTYTSKNIDKSLIFRGLNEAKFKLYNSGQRRWIGEELDKFGKTYLNFIELEIEKAKSFQNNLLVKFYSALGHKAYDFSILSFLQHYGAPTPLLDFTYSFDCAAFFATDQLLYKPSTDIENYFSIYMIDTSNVKNELASFFQLIQSSLENIDTIIENTKIENVNYEKILDQFRILDFKTFYDLKLFHIPGFNIDNKKFKLKNYPNFELIINQHNLNIINQEGLFVFNSDPLTPLENLFTGKQKENQTFILPKIKCWNIHKRFKDYFIRYLTEGTDKKRNFPINRAFIYPQEEEIAKYAFETFKKVDW